jgi:lysine/ornithine N-monooxygenase
LQQCRKFLAEQYAQTGLNLHSECSPTEVKKQSDGKYTVVIKDASGALKELTDNDAVMMATGDHHTLMYNSYDEVAHVQQS